MNHPTDWRESVTQTREFWSAGYSPSTYVSFKNGIFKIDRFGHIAKYQNISGPSKDRIMRRFSTWIRIGIANVSAVGNIG